MGISAKRLQEAFPQLTPELAQGLSKLTRYFNDAGVKPFPGEEDLPTSDDVLEYANKYLKGYGVEAVECPECQVDRYYYGIVLLYVNMGDTYSTTLLYDTEKERFLIGDWGDWFERHEGKHGSGD